MAETRTLGAPNDDDTLGNVFDAMFGGVGVGPVTAIGRAMGAVGLASMGRQPSHKATASALTGGFSRLGDFFDSLAARGIDVQSRGPLAGPRPELSDQAVRDALEAQAMESEPLSSAMRGAIAAQQSGVAVESDVQSGFSGAPQEGTRDPGLGVEGSRESGSSPSSARGPDPAGAEGLAEGGALLVTKKMLKGPDPEGPDEGEIKMTVQEGEMVMVIPRDLVQRYGPEKFKMLNRAIIDGLKQHMGQGMMKGKVSVKRASAL